MARRGKRTQHVIVDSVHVPTKDKREQVCKLVASGLSATQVAFVLGCAEHEVRQHYEQELEHGEAMVTGAMGVALIENGLKGDTNAQRAYLQMRARWTVPQHVELTGKDGGPVIVEQRRAAIQRILKLASAGQTRTEVDKVKTEEGQNAPLH